MIRWGADHRRTRRRVRAPKVTPGPTAGAPPSDAIVLFDGRNLDAWKSADGGDAKWRVDNGDAPLVNATLPSETWQVYDIVFAAPDFAADGSLASPARVTVFHNGVLVQNDVALRGSTTYIGAPIYRPHGNLPLRLQDHSHEVRYRNIWLRRL